MRVSEIFLMNKWKIIKGPTQSTDQELFKIMSKWIIIPNEIPTSATAAGTVGQIAWGADYIYICTATNTWKRAAIGTW